MMVVITFSGVFAAVFVVVFVSILLAFEFKSWLKQRRCKHDGGVNETSSCDAICRKCLKNLGFIGTWREQVLKRDCDERRVK